MTTLLSAPARRIAHNHERRDWIKAPQPAAVSADRVREMLQEIAFVLHTTRVVRRMDEGDLSKKG
jgi:hypothetical protein